MKRVWWWGIGGGLAALVFLGSKTNTGAGIVTTAANALGFTTAEQRANFARWLPTIHSAEQSNGLPVDLLSKLLYQESRFRTDIITGATKSAVGALGIAQFMPATAQDLGINPLDPAQAIPAAARYLASLYHQTGTWQKAVAAYNWGVGNVLRKGLARAPDETRNYVKAITGQDIA